MCDTAPLAPPHAPTGRAGPTLIRSVPAPGSAMKLARAFSGEFRPRRDATLAADRQMTHLADVAPTLAVAPLAASLPRRPSLTRRVRAVCPPTRRVSEGGIAVSETTGLLASNSTSEGRCGSRAKKLNQLSSAGTKCDPRRENEILSRRESLSRRGGKRFPDRGGRRCSGEILERRDRQASENFPMLGRDNFSRYRGHCPNQDGVPLSQFRMSPVQEVAKITKSQAENQQEPTGPTSVKS
jgi:hypothetical protein